DLGDAHRALGAVRHPQPPPLRQEADTALLQDLLCRYPVQRLLAKGTSQHIEWQESIALHGDPADVLTVRATVLDPVLGQHPSNATASSGARRGVLLALRGHRITMKLQTEPQDREAQVREYSFISIAVKQRREGR